MELEVQRWIAVNSPCHSVSISKDGQFAVAAHEYGIEIYSASGESVMLYPDYRIEFPIIQVATDPSFGTIYLLNRTGMVVRLEIKKDGNRFSSKASIFYQSRNPDIKSLSLSSDGSVLALGYLTSGLAVFQKDGKYKRRHPDDGTATIGSYWSVALNGDGSKLYAGSATIASGLNAVVSFDTTGTNLLEQLVRYKLPARSAVKNILTLSNQIIVIVVSIGSDPTQDCVIALSSSLEEKMWEYCPGDTITAIAIESSRALVILGMGYMGNIVLLDGNSGQAVKYGEKIVLSTMVNDLSIAEGGVAAVTEDGHLVIFRYSD